MLTGKSDRPLDAAAHEPGDPSLDDAPPRDLHRLPSNGITAAAGKPRLHAQLGDPGDRGLTMLRQFSGTDAPELGQELPCIRPGEAPAASPEVVGHVL